MSHWLISRDEDVPVTAPLISSDMRKLLENGVEEQQRTYNYTYKYWYVSFHTKYLWYVYLFIYNVYLNLADILICIVFVDLALL